MNATTRRSNLLAALLTSAAMLAPSLAFADSMYEELEDIPDILSLFESDAETETAEEEDSSTQEGSDDGHAANTKKASPEEDASR